MKLWRRIVSVLAGTMIAAGGVLGTVAVLEASAPTPGGHVASPSVTFDIDHARTATESDAAAFNGWVSAPARSDAPTREERNTAALGANAIAEATGGASPSGTASGQGAPTESVLRGNYSGSTDWLADSADIVGAANSTPTADPDSDGMALSTPVVTFADAVPSANLTAFSIASATFSTRAYTVLDTSLDAARNYTATEPTDRVGQKAATTDVPQPVANWSQAALEEINARFDSGTLETDTLNLSLASQAMRAGRPSAADAINAELRYRQSLDGSIGGIRETSEAARALATGSSADQEAAVRALNWLDAQGPLAPELAVYRLRAHAFDGMLIAAADACPTCYTTTAPPAPSTYGGAPGAPSAVSSGVSGKGALALWLLVGGIGLSLSLVTVDALRGSRQRLYDTIRASPGLHVNELRRRLHMSPSSIEYHLSVLAGAGLIVAEDDGRYKRYYANGAGLGLNPRSPHSRNTLGALRRPHAVTLVRALCDRPEGGTARELSRTLSLHESACARRLAHLEDAGILTSERRGRARLYRVRDTAAALKALSAIEEAPPVVATAPAPLQNASSEPPAPTVGAKSPG